jgi:hypothetical protein
MIDFLCLDHLSHHRRCDVIPARRLREPLGLLDVERWMVSVYPDARYRGAAPVTRALQDGCTVSGVSLVFTVLKCDAGPVLEQQQVRAHSTDSMWHGAGTATSGLVCIAGPSIIHSGQQAAK